MSETKDERTRELYADYLAEAQDMAKRERGVILPIAIAGLVIGCLAITSFLWAGYRAGAYGVWLGIIVLFVAAVVMFAVQNRWWKREAAGIARGKPGFQEFERLYRRRYWPKPMATGEKLQKFRSIVSGT